jgi:hypothetical protein
VVWCTKLEELTTIKKESIMKAYISVIILTLLSVFTLNAYAEPAIVFQGDLCAVMLIPDGGDPIVLVGDKFQANVSNSGSDVPSNPAKMTCQGHHVEVLEAAILQRTPCVVIGTPYGDVFTEDGKTVFTPGGNWTAQCMFRKE